jgi:glycosyltransferase involved in cell wall biosynthesis
MTIESTKSRLPLVSVIIPTYNMARFVSEAVRSVLEQTYPKYEVIVVDDGSTDATKDELDKFGDQIRYLHQDNRGPSAARNLGIKIARGEYICFLDSDDLWLPNKLIVQHDFMERNHDIDFVFSDHEEFNAEKIVLRSFFAEKVFRVEITSQIPVQEAFRKLVIENFISTPTVMVRKVCFEKVGLFDESLSSVEDRDMWLRIAAYFRIACLPVIVCRRRIHESNISRDSELSMRSRTKVLESNRRRFSHLVPTGTWNSLLADAYLQLGYVLLEKGQRMRALQASCRSLTYAARQAVNTRSASTYAWTRGLALVPATILGWQVTQSLLKIRNNLFIRKKQAA